MTKIKEYRERLGLKQEDVANYLGIAQSTVSMWETGESSPRLETLIQLSKMFNCTLDELVGQEKQIADYEAESKEDV